MAPRGHTNYGNHRMQYFFFPSLKSCKNRNHANKVKCPDRSGSVPTVWHRSTPSTIRHTGVKTLNLNHLNYHTKQKKIWTAEMLKTTSQKILVQHWPRGEKRSSEKQSFSWQDTESLLPIIRAVIFSASHDMLGSRTANQCPGELFMPALSLIHLYYSDRWLQSSNGWTHRALQTVGAETVQWEDHRQKSRPLTVSVQVHVWIKL